MAWASPCDLDALPQSKFTQNFLKFENAGLPQAITSAPDLPLHPGFQSLAIATMVSEVAFQENQYSFFPSPLTMVGGTRAAAEELSKLITDPKRAWGLGEIVYLIHNRLGKSRNRFNPTTLSSFSETELYPGESELLLIEAVDTKAKPAFVVIHDGYPESKLVAAFDPVKAEVLLYKASSSPLGEIILTDSGSNPFADARARLKIKRIVKLESGERRQVLTDHLALMARMDQFSSVIYEHDRLLMPVLTRMSPSQTRAHVMSLIRDYGLAREVADFQMPDPDGRADIYALILETRAKLNALVETGNRLKFWQWLEDNHFIDHGNVRSINPKPLNQGQLEKRIDDQTLARIQAQVDILNQIAPDEKGQLSFDEKMTLTKVMNAYFEISLEVDKILPGTANVNRALQPLYDALERILDDKTLAALRADPLAGFLVLKDWAQLRRSRAL